MAVTPQTDGPNWAKELWNSKEGPQHEAISSDLDIILYSGGDFAPIPGEASPFLVEGERGEWVELAPSQDASVLNLITANLPEEEKEEVEEEIRELVQQYEERMQSISELIASNAAIAEEVIAATDSPAAAELASNNKAKETIGSNTSEASSLNSRMQSSMSEALTSFLWSDTTIDAGDSSATSGSILTQLINPTLEAKLSDVKEAVGLASPDLLLNTDAETLARLFSSSPTEELTTSEATIVFSNMASAITQELTLLLESLESIEEDLLMALSDSDSTTIVTLELELDTLSSDVSALGDDLNAVIITQFDFDGAPDLWAEGWGDDGKWNSWQEELYAWEEQNHDTANPVWELERAMFYVRNLARSHMDTEAVNAFSSLHAALTTVNYQLDALAKAGQDITQPSTTDYLNFGQFLWPSVMRLEALLTQEDYLVEPFKALISTLEDSGYIPQWRGENISAIIDRTEQKFDLYSTVFAEGAFPEWSAEIYPWENEIDNYDPSNDFQRGLLFLSELTLSYAPEEKYLEFGELVDKFFELHTFIAQGGNVAAGGLPMNEDGLAIIDLNNEIGDVYDSIESFITSEPYLLGPLSSFLSGLEQFGMTLEWNGTPIGAALADYENSGIPIDEISQDFPDTTDISVITNLVSDLLNQTVDSLLTDSEEDIIILTGTQTINLNSTSVLPTHGSQLVTDSGNFSGAPSIEEEAMAQEIALT